jgi:hypothetical protein
VIQSLLSHSPYFNGGWEFDNYGGKDMIKSDFVSGCVFFLRSRRKKASATLKPQMMWLMMWQQSSLSSFLYLPLSIEGRDKLRSLTLFLASSAVKFLSTSSIPQLHRFLGSPIGLAF